MYPHKRKLAIITWRRIFEIVFVLSFRSSPVIKQMIHEILVRNPLLIHKIDKYRIIRLSLQLKCVYNYYDDVILTNALRSDICKYLAVVGLPRAKYAFDCKYISFCIQLNNFIRLGIANSFIFVIFTCCCLYVMPQLTFSDQIRLRHFIV